MAYKLIEKLKLKKIECIVAPYEADAQLAYLCISKYVSCVITEDSDLIPYGCPNTFFKMDKVKV
jgi:exonuclease 1